LDFLSFVEDRGDALSSAAGFLFRDEADRALEDVDWVALEAEATGWSVAVWPGVGSAKELA